MSLYSFFLKGGGAGVTVNEAVLITPPYVAEMVTVVEAAKTLVVTVKLRW